MTGIHLWLHFFFLIKVVYCIKEEKFYRLVSQYLQQSQVLSSLTRLIHRTFLLHLHENMSAKQP